MKQVAPENLLPTIKSIKSDVWAIRLFHRYIPKAKNKISDNKIFELKSTPDGRVDRAWTEVEYKKMLHFCIRFNNITSVVVG